MGLNGQIKDELLAVSTGQIYYSKDEPRGSEADMTWFSSLKPHSKQAKSVENWKMESMLMQSLNLKILKLTLSLGIFKN